MPNKMKPKTSSKGASKVPSVGQKKQQTAPKVAKVPIPTKSNNVASKVHAKKG